MNIFLIMPGVGRKTGHPYVRSWLMEPLGLAVLAAITPPDVNVRFIDDRLEPIPYDDHPDLVAINLETYTASRAYGIARRFRRKQIPVVMGGYHATLAPEDTSANCDAVIIGEAERVWLQVLSDAQAGRLHPIYRSEEYAEQPWIVPKREIYRSHRYLPVTLMEAGRGCSFGCRFCSVTCFFRKHYRQRPIADIVAEIRTTRARTLFFIDDNIVSDLAGAKALFKALIPLKIKWIGQGSITMASDEELLRLMRQSGCIGVLIGFESLNEQSLKGISKSWNMTGMDYRAAVERIHRHRIAIYATFMFGHDEDDPDSITNTVTFAQEQGFFMAAFNHIVPFPGTPLYRQLEQQGRLLYPKWWLEPGLEFGDVVFKPARMQPEELARACFNARKQFYAPFSLLRRALNVKGNCSSLMRVGQFFWLNLFSDRGVRERQHLPIGEGLDGELA